MSYKPNEATWMAYLYGELESAERERLEHYLLNNASARQELESFKALQQMLRTVEDKEVIAPPLVLNDSRQRNLWDFPYAKTIVSIAASLVLLMIAGKFTNTTISTQNGLHISFGGQPLVESANLQPALTQARVQQMINASLATNNTGWDTRLEENKKTLTEALRKTAASTRNSEQVETLVQQVANASKEQVQGYVATLQNENMKMMREYLQLTTSEQKDYMETLLVDFSKYLQQQRNSDLQLLQTKITDVEQNSNLFKAETEQVLTSLIGTNTGRTPGIRN
jgi:hypothetical protein